MLTDDVDPNNIQHLLLRAFGTGRDLSLVSSRNIALYPGYQNPILGEVGVDGRLKVELGSRL